MNLLEIVILQIFLLLFSMPSKPATSDEVDTKRVETCGVEYGVEDLKTTRGRYLEVDGPAADSSEVEKVQSNGGVVVSRPVISSSKPKTIKRARILPKPSSVVFPK